MTESAAQSLKWQNDGQDITAIILENVVAAAAAESRPVEPADWGHGVGVLLSAAWTLAQMAHPDRTVAIAAYAELLRNAANSIDGIGGRTAGEADGQ